MLLAIVLTSVIATAGLSAWRLNGCRAQWHRGPRWRRQQSCPGTPIVIGQIASLTGTFAYPDVSVASKVAVRAVNRTCEAGHPLKLITCDDQNDPNVAVTCAHKLVSDRVVAMVGNASAQLSQAMAITQAAGIPSVFNAGLSPWEFTNALSYPLSVSLVQAIAIVEAAAGSGAKSIELLAADAPLAVGDHRSHDVGRQAARDHSDPCDCIHRARPTSRPVAAQAIASKSGRHLGCGRREPGTTAVSRACPAGRCQKDPPYGLLRAVYASHRLPPWAKRPTASTSSLLKRCLSGHGQ